MATTKIPKTIKVDSYFASRMSVSPDGRSALISGQLGAMFHLDFSTWKASPWTRLSSAPNAIQHSPDGAKVALSFASESSANERVEVRNSSDGSLLASFDARDPAQASAVIETLSWSPNGARIVGVSSSAVDKDSPHLAVFDLARSSVKHLRVCSHYQLAAGFLDDRTVLALTSRKLQPGDGPDTDLLMLDLETGAIERKGDGAMDVVKSVERLADGRMFATALYDAARVIDRDANVLWTAGKGGLAFCDGSQILTMDGRKNLERTTPDGVTTPIGKAAKASFAMFVVAGHLLLLQERQVQVIPLQ
jgi:hypothetical protein